MTSVSPNPNSSSSTSNNSASQSAQSYASATKKAVPSPPIATGSSTTSPAVAVGNVAPVQQKAKSPSVTPVNGRPSGGPAVPGAGNPAVANGNGHQRNASAMTGGFIANGATHNKPPIQFGSVADSPSMSHSTPQIAQSTPTAPVAIPSNPRVTSPAQSPSPIPQPAASGGRPPSGIQGGMTFGSLPGDEGRHMRNISVPQNAGMPGSDHIRRPSGGEFAGPGRGGFNPQQGGRGRNNSQSGFNPQQPIFNGPGSYRNQNGRGNPMAQPFQGPGRQMQYPNSPHQPARSPALTNSVPTTPNMGPAMPIQQQPQYGYPQHYMPQQAYGYAQPPYDARLAGMPMATPYGMYPQMGYMQGIPGAPQSPQPGYQQPYMPTQQYIPQQPQPMSRTGSQMSERPSSTAGQPQTPLTKAAVVHSTPQAKPATTSPFIQRTARKSAAIVIKNPDGGIVNLPSAKAPASPAPSNQSSKTPPVVVSSTPTPPPQHTRADSKRDADVLKEFKEKVAKAAEEKAEKEAAAKTEEPKAEEKPVEEAKPVEEKKTSEEDAAAAAKKKQEEEDEELERQIREIEEAEAAREKAEAEILAKRAAQKAIDDAANAEKKKAEDAENDRKLREQEREMERLEDERERKRQEAEAKASGGESKEEAKKPFTPSSLASKLSNLSIGGDSGASTPASDDSMGPPPPRVAGLDKTRKPAALNLAPLNTKPVEPAQPSAALQSLKSAHFLTSVDPSIYPANIQSPNPALNPAATSKGKAFKYDKEFLLQFQKVFTEKPSLEFESQIKALIGDPEGGSSRAGSSRGGASMGERQRSNRGPAPGTFTMGTFGKTLPPGTTSQQRYEMSQGTIPRPGANPMSGSFRSASNFPGGMTGGRQPSGMGNPSSPRTNPSRGGRQGSKREPTHGKNNAEAEKKMPLTAGMVLKPIEVTATGWKPRSIVGAPATGAAGPAPGGLMDPEMVQRKVKAALNKMTPEKFDKIADQILAIAAQSKDEVDGRTLRQVIQLTFEKATDEAHWASMYAKFCKRMLETMSPEIRDESILDKNGNVVSGGNLFKKYLLNRCQEEFERGWKTDIGEKPEGEAGDAKTEEAALLSDDYYKAAAAKRRGLGLVQFIGELYKLGMLTERIMHECVKKLVDYQGMPDEAEVESLTKLLKTIGGNLDNTEKGPMMMDVYFARIQAMIDTPDLIPRLKFMLMDVVDLRKARWHSKEANKGPKTLDEIRADAEAAAAAKAAESARGPRGGGGRMQMGRGDSRNFSQYGNQPPVDYSKNTVATDDLRRLTSKGAGRSSGAPMSFAPTSMFSSRSNSGRKMGPGGALTRGGEDSGASSRTGTPPQQKEKEPVATINAFSALSDLADHEPENPASPPPVASPELTKADLQPADSEAKDSEDKEKDS